MRKLIITLDDDTANFLELIRTGGSQEGASAFINSLLRQERFRQGYPANAGAGISMNPASNPVEQSMLGRSGLLPYPGNRGRR